MSVTLCPPSHSMPLLHLPYRIARDTSPLQGYTQKFINSRFTLFKGVSSLVVHYELSAYEAGLHWITRLSTYAFEKLVLI